MKAKNQKIDELLKAALQCNISIFDFYDMTLKEVKEVIEAYNKKHKLDLQEKAYIAYQEAQLIALFNSQLFAKSTRPLPTIFEAFKGLFDDEVVKQLELEKEKNNFLTFVANHNARRS